MSGCSCVSKRAAIYTLGCRLNQGESRLIEDQLLNAGYEMVPFNEPADIGIIHTCVVTREAEAKSRKMIHRFARLNPDAPIIVIGCYAQTSASAIASMPGVRLVLGNDAKMNLADHLTVLDDEPAHIIANRPKRDLFTVPFIKEGAPITRRVNLKIQDGCDAMCTYCYIPFARGRSRSRYFDDAIAEAASLVKRGAKEIVLTGVNLGDYRDGNHGLAALVDALDNLEPKPRIRISSIELNTISNDLICRMANPVHGLVPHFHIPLQSGSDAVLKAMGRPYTANEYFRFIENAVSQLPCLGLGADVMVGFPGETDEDFETTCDNIQRSPLNYLHVFQYSERRQVASARISGKVPAVVMQRRSEMLRQIGEEKHLAFMHTWIGRDVEVLFESRQDNYWIGHTANYLEVAANSCNNLENKIVRVHINEMDKHHLKGNLISMNEE